MSEVSFSLGELAQRFGLELRGDADFRIHGVGTLCGAQRHQIGFLANPRYRRELGETRAGAVILREADAAQWAGQALIAKDPYVAFAKIAALFEPQPCETPGIHPSAVIDASAKIDPSAHIGPQTVIGARSVVGAGAMIGPGCVIGEDNIVGDACTLIARVTLVTRVRLGARVRIHPGAVIGADGFGLAMDRGHWIKVPQLGGVLIGDDCEIGANTTIDRGAIEDTVLEEDVRVDNLVQIAHNCRIGAHSAMAAFVGLAGSTKIGRYCMMAGGSGASGHLEIADKVVVLARSVVTQSITEPGEYGANIPAQEASVWRRNLAALRRLGKRRSRE